ncbi:MAG: type II toxin-antitoxin system VapC family toxin [Solirubrobacteraceae bacterium]
MTLLVDTGVFLAYADTSDQDHERCPRIARWRYRRPAYHGPCRRQTDWLIERQLGARAEADFYRWVVDGDLSVDDLTTRDTGAIIELTEQYADNGLGGVDASLVAVAERLELDTIATLDQRHFRVIRPKHVDTFKIVP